MTPPLPSQSAVISRDSSTPTLLSCHLPAVTQSAGGLRETFRQGKEQRERRAGSPHCVESTLPAPGPPHRFPDFRRTLPTSNQALSTWAIPVPNTEPTPCSGCHCAHQGYIRELWSRQALPQKSEKGWVFSVLGDLTTNLLLLRARFIFHLGFILTFQMAFPVPSASQSSSIQWGQPSREIRGS